MESLIVHPESADQLKTIKAVLTALKVPFELRENSLPEHVLKSIDVSLDQFDKGNVISLDEFKEKHFQKR
jgi:hypothetical protein